MTPEEILEGAGLTLDTTHPVVANYVPVIRLGSLVLVAGHGPFVGGKPAYRGKLGADMSVEDGQRAAAATALNVLATLKTELGELSRIRRFVKLLVFVNSTPEFAEHHLVANGATDLLVTVFGDAGRPTRSAVGMCSLPLNFAVEMEGMVEIDE